MLTVVSLVVNVVIDGARGILITRGVVRAFVDQGLRGAPASTFAATVGRYAELHAP